MDTNWAPDPLEEQVHVEGVCDLCFTAGRHQLVELHNFKRVLLCVDCLASIEQAEATPMPKL